MKRIFFTVLLAVFLAVPSVAWALEPSEQFYVTDTAGVLSDEQQREMVNRSTFLCNENGVQVVTVVVRNVIGNSIDEYATEVFNDFGIGSKEDNNGVLLIVAVDDGDVKIELGEGMEQYISDSRAGSMLDETFMPTAKDGDIAKAIYDTHMALIAAGSKSATEGYSDAAQPAASPAAQEAKSGGDPFGFATILMVIVVVMFVMIFMSYMSGMSRRRRGYYGGPMFFGFFRPRRRWGHHHHHHAPPPSSSWGAPGQRQSTPSGFKGGGGRSSGGGASRSFGSSGSFGGRSSGGSSGGFKGGGGRSSGGGASRKF